MLRATLVVLAFAAGSTALAQDKVVLKDGKQKDVKILSEDYDAIWYSLEGGQTSIPWKQVQSVKYSNVPKYYKAMEVFDQGNWAAAAPQIEEQAADTKQRAVVRTEMLYNLGSAYEHLGDRDKALAAFNEMLKLAPKSRYVVPAGRSMVMLHLAKGDTAAAQGALDSVLSATKASGISAGAQAGLDLLRGDILEAQSKPNDAKAIYDKISTQSGVDTDVQLAAKLGVARCSQESAPAEAERRYREIVVADAPNTILSGAWNGLGDLSLKQGSEKRDSDLVRDALFAYLRGVVLYVPGRGESSREHERALSGASKAFEALGQLENNPERKKMYLDRSKQNAAQLASLYPDSKFKKGN